MKFLNLFNKSKIEFRNIQGFDDVKEIISRALDTEENYNLLLYGPSASSKTIFLLGIQEIESKAIYFDASNTTNRILDVLEQERSRIILLDELDKMGKTFQNQLLNFLESGHIKVDQQKKSYDFVIDGAKVFASCNDINRLSKPLQSRFRILFLPRYSEQQFIAISQKVLPKLRNDLSSYIGKLVFSNGGDIRNVISIGKLVKKEDGPEAIDLILKTLMKYRKDEESKER